MKKKLTALLMAVLVFAMLTGCSNSAPAAAATAQPAAIPAETLPAQPVTSTVPAAAAATQSTIEVSTVNELLAALGSDRVVHLNKGIYNLTEASNYGKGGSAAYYWNNLWDDYYELVLTSVSNLTLTGEGEIVTVPRDPDVFRMRDCSNITLEGLTFGHTLSAEACQGGVIELYDCRSVTFDSCNLYGCGTIGIYGSNCRDISVRNSAIYHCSSAAVEFSASSGVVLESCRMYDIGTYGDYGNAWTIFGFYDSKNVTIRSCEVYDTRSDALYFAWDTGTVSMSDLSVHDNHLSTVFNYNNAETVVDFSPENNVVERWCGSPYGGGDSLGYITLPDGRTMDNTALNETYSDQIASAGLGTVDVEYKELDHSGTTEIHVSSVDEFLKAIAPDTTIYIDCDSLDLTTASDYGSNALEDRYDSDRNPSDFSDSPYRWSSVYDGYRLEIGYVSNLHIVGSEYIREITTSPRYANVLSFFGCTDLSVEALTLGHSPEQGECAGGVIYLQDCSSVILDNCGLYGCGIMGIETQNVRDLTAQFCQIYDCSWTGASLSGSDQVSFLDCQVWDVPSPQINLYNTTNFSWDRVLMDSDARFDPVCTNAVG